MEPTERPPMADEVRQQLVAYLDGELSPEASLAMEQRLAEDKRLRRELQELEQAWNALDALPRETVDEDFAKTTIEMVAVAAAEDLNTQTTMLPTQRRRQRFHLLLLLAVVGLGSFVAARFGPRDPDRELVEHLPVILHADTYPYVPDVEFLRELVAGPAARIRIAMFISPAELEAMLLPADVRGDDSARRRWIAALSPEEKHGLVGKAQRFGQLPPDERLRQQELDRAIADDRQRQRLETGLQLYAQILAETSAAQRAQLESASRERLTSVVRDIALEIHGAQVAVSDDELAAIRRQVLSFQASDPRRFRELMGKLQALRRDARRTAQQRLTNPNRLPEERRERFRELAQLLPSELRTSIEEVLDDKSRARLQRRPEPWRTQVLVNWIKRSLQGARLNNISHELLESFFASEQLSDEQRQQLLALPTSEMMSELEHHYRRKMKLPPGTFRGPDMPIRRPNDRLRDRRAVDAHPGPGRNPPQRRRATIDRMGQDGEDGAD